jgi:hypothetical protein
MSTSAPMTSSQTGEADAPAKQIPTRAKRLRLRPWLRSLHRDVGYLAVGLTLVYALSGLAVNHIDDWDPNFVEIQKTHELKGPLPKEDEGLARHVLSALGETTPPDEVFRLSPTEVEIAVGSTTYLVNPQTSVVQQRAQRPRFLLRFANWLHLNRGKRAWTYIADGYAAFLLFLAGSGLFMIPTRKGRWFGRRALLTTLGAMVPVVYVAISGP